MIWFNNMHSGYPVLARDTKQYMFGQVKEYQYTHKSISYHLICYRCIFIMLLSEESSIRKVSIGVEQHQQVGLSFVRWRISRMTARTLLPNTTLSRTWRWFDLTTCIHATPYLSMRQRNICSAKLKNTSTHTNPYLTILYVIDASSLCYCRRRAASGRFPLE
jgi:hypothetical protein